MRLVSYRSRAAGAGGWKPGIVAGDLVHDAASIAAEVLPDGDLVGSMRELIALGGDALGELAAATAGRQGGEPRDRLRLGPPIPDPDKIICVGLNYREHAGEVNMAIPEAPILFAKFRNSLIGDGDSIVLPSQSKHVDYEGELALVIGQRCKDVPLDRALDMVAGYMPFNDVSARDLQMKTSQWTAGKAIDTFAPCGPELVTADQISDVGSLELTTRLNGDVVQQASTALMMFDVPTLVSYTSSVMTLEPGDVIATGTPAGVGFTREPPLYLLGGDLVEVEIGGLGVLTNPVALA